MDESLLGLIGSGIGAGVGVERGREAALRGAALLAVRFFAALFGAALRADRVDLAAFLPFLPLAPPLAPFAALRPADFFLVAFLFLVAMISLLIELPVDDHTTHSPTFAS